MTLYTNFVILLFVSSTIAEERNLIVVRLPGTMGDKERLADVDTYAELKYDPRGSLPEDFTICSSILVLPSQNSVWPTFFAILIRSPQETIIPFTKSSKSLCVAFPFAIITACL